MGDAAGLADRFDDPPPEARPLTWWHWMNGNVTREGITADLEWMAEQGIGGVHVFETNQTPAEGPAVYRSPEWEALMRFAMDECSRLGLVFGVHNCSGWNMAGGPWVDPEESMKELTFAETTVQGPGQIDTPIARSSPPEIHPFSRENVINRWVEDFAYERTDYEPYYEDVAVLAFPKKTPGLSMRERKPGIEATAVAEIGAPDALFDGDLTSGIFFDHAALRETKQLSLTITFDEPCEARSFKAATAGPGVPFIRWGTEVVLEAKTSSGAFEELGRSRFTHNGILRTYASFNFPETRSEEYRVVVEFPKNAGFAPHFDVGLTELQLSPEPRIEDWPKKAFRLREKTGSIAGGASGDSPLDRFAIPGGDVIDLTDKLRPDGTLDWDVPPGTWTILRIGMVSTGKMNQPATVGGVGLEVDKMDAAILERFLEEGSVGQLIEAGGEHVGETFNFLSTDSWEVGTQTWSRGFAAEFQRRRGYAITPWLPALEGRIVDSVEKTERFLWDYRRTVSELHAEVFTAGLREYAHRHRMVYGGQPFNNGAFNDMEVGGQMDVVSAEFWPNREGHNWHTLDLLVPSMAHTYGKPIIEAEAFTASNRDAAYRQHPKALKALGDWAFTRGVNRYKFHTSAHQPWLEVQPGMSMGPFGINMHRNNTWAEQAHGWLEYIQRCQALLQEGRYVADLAYFIGEGAPNTIEREADARAALEGWRANAIDHHMLLQASVEDGAIVLPSGMRYRLLVLPERETMTPQIAEKIRELVNAGATILGPKPERSPSLSGYPECDARVRAIAGEVWGERPTGGPRKVGEGLVFTDGEPAEVLEELGVERQFRFESEDRTARIDFIQRTGDGADYFFLASPGERPHTAELSFRTTRGAPELWDAETGERFRVPAFRTGDGRTSFSHTFGPQDSIFVVFPDEPTTEATPPEFEAAGEAMTLEGAWTVRFQPGRGAPEEVVLDELMDWAKHPDEGVQYFSGSAVYEKSVVIPEAWLGEDRRVLLDLGEVREIAEVAINGSVLPVSWNLPHEVDVTEALRPGGNELFIRVTNLWPNRIIGDHRQFRQAQEWFAEDGDWHPAFADPDVPLPDGRITGYSWKMWHAGAELLPSGLLGPVKLVPLRTMAPQASHHR